MAPRTFSGIQFNFRHKNPIKLPLLLGAFIFVFHPAAAAASTSAGLEEKRWKSGAKTGKKTLDEDM